MEVSPVEHKQPSKTVHAVRERIVGFHDRYLKVTPLSEDITASFADVSSTLKSNKGRELADRLHTHMDTLAKQAEIAAAAGDFVIGLVTTGVGLAELKKTMNARSQVNRNTTGMPSRAEEVLRMAYDTGKNNKQTARSLGITALGGGIFAFRPLTRLTDIGVRISRPLARTVVQTVDALLLRGEARRAAKQVFVGTGKA